MAATLAAFGSLQLIGLVSGATVARLLGVDSRGVLAALYLWPVIIAYVGDLGGPISYAFEAAARPLQVPRLIGNALVLTLLQGGLLIAVGVPVALHAERGYGADSTAGIVFLIIFIPINLLQRYLVSILQGLGDFVAFSGAIVGVQLLYLSGLLTLTIIGLHEVRWVLAVILGANTVVLLAASARVSSHIGSRPAIDWSLLTRTFRYGLRAHVGNLAPIENLQLDLVIVVAALGAHSAGLYAVATAASAMVRGQGTAIGAVALPSAASGRERRAQLSTATAMFRAGLVLNVASGAILFVFAGWLIGVIYGPPFAPAATVTRVLLVAAVAASLRRIIGDSMRGLAEPLQATAAEGLSWIILATTLLVLLPRYGMIGAAVAVTLSYFTALAISIVFAVRMGASPIDLFRIRSHDLRFLFHMIRDIRVR